MNSFVKDPQATLDYLVDWAAYLGTDTIATSTFTVDAGITVGTGLQAPSNTPTSATVWLSGGSVGQTYKVVNKIVTAAGRTDERTFMLSVQNR